jgi:hypothetical protein
MDAISVGFYSLKYLGLTRDRYRLAGPPVVKLPCVVSIFASFGVIKPVSINGSLEAASA